MSAEPEWRGAAAVSRLWVPPSARALMPRTPAPSHRGGSWRALPRDDVLRALAAQGARGVRAYERDGVRVIVAREPTGVNGALLWHLSLSCDERYPTWDELADARYDLLPDDLTMAMLLPPARDYVNLHQWVFHLHELRTEEEP